VPIQPMSAAWQHQNNPHQHQPKQSNFDLLTPYTERSDPMSQPLMAFERTQQHAYSAPSPTSSQSFNHVESLIVAASLSESHASSYRSDTSGSYLGSRRESTTRMMSGMSVQPHAERDTYMQQRQYPPAMPVGSPKRARPFPIPVPQPFGGLTSPVFANTNETYIWILH
jgi:hypothetical protein